MYLSLVSLAGYLPPQAGICSAGATPRCSTGMPHPFLSHHSLCQLQALHQQMAESPGGGGGSRFTSAAAFAQQAQQQAAKADEILAVEAMVTAATHRILLQQQQQQAAALQIPASNSSHRSSCAGTSASSWLYSPSMAASAAANDGVQHLGGLSGRESPFAAAAAATASASTSINSSGHAHMRMGLIPGRNLGAGTEEGGEASVAAAAAGWPQRATAVGDQCYHTPVTMGCRTCFYSDPGARQALSRQVSPAGVCAGNSLGCTGVSALVPEALALQSRTIKCSLCGVGVCINRASICLQHSAQRSGWS